MAGGHSGSRLTDAQSIASIDYAHHTDGTFKIKKNALKQCAAIVFSGQMLVEFEFV